MDGFDLTKLCIQFDFGCSNAVAKSVLVALASHYNEDNGKVWPGAEVLCREASCHRNSLFNAIKWLRENNLIETKRTWGGNVYKFNLELISRGRFDVSAKTSTFGSTKKDTNGSTRFSTNKSTKSSTTESTENSTSVSIKSDTSLSTESRTQTNKEQIKETKKINRNFFLMTDAELVEFFSSVSHEEGIEARAEYTRRVEERNKSVMMSDFDMPSRPRYQILGMKH